MKVLILDDQWKMFAPRLDVAAAKAGVALTYAATPKEAENIIKQGSFDALLLDGHLNREDTLRGPDVLRAWKSCGFALPPVLMFSSDEEMQKEGIEAGAAGVVNKLALLGGDFGSVQQALELN